MFILKIKMFFYNIMSILYNGDCLEEMKQIEDKSIDLIFVDLPYGQTSCKWDVKIDLTKMWEQYMRIKKLNTPIFFTTTTKFGVDIINSAPKKCPFRYDIVWCKSAPAGFLCVSNESIINVKDKGNIQIKNVKNGDYVNSKNGFIKVLDYFDNGEKDCFEIITNNDLKLILTKDHKIETKNGMKALEDINIYNQEQILTENGFEYIKTIEYVGKKNTCDIEVEHEDHTYYCNNISISNSAKKMPMRKHEMVYVFYEKLPFYDLSSHKHKFIDQSKNKNKLNDGIIYNGGKEMKVISDGKGKQYSPPLPVSVVKEVDEKYKNKGGLYSKVSRNGLVKNEPHYDPPLPVSVVKEPEPEYTLNEDYDKREKKTRNTIKKQEIYDKGYLEKKVNFRKYDATLGGKGAPSHLYSPPLPVSVVKEPEPQITNVNAETLYGNIQTHQPANDDGTRSNYRGKTYSPPLPTTMLEIKSTRGKHSTEKPVALMEWVLKYYSKEGDVVLDNCMGSGSTGVACQNMNRNFIGIEKDPEIYEVAFNRINPE